MKNIFGQIHNNLIFQLLSSGLHLGSQKTTWNSDFKPYLKGFRNNRCIINPTFTHLYLKRAIKFLLYLHKSKKRILFIGAPFGLEKDFSHLCLKYKHFFLDEDSAKFFTNFNLILKKRKNFFHMNSIPSLIFVFNPLSSSFLLDFASLYNIPLMGFVNTDDKIGSIDYPIFANVKSQKGGIFGYKFFSYFFSLQKLLVSNKSCVRSKKKVLIRKYGYSKKYKKNKV